MNTVQTHTANAAALLEKLALMSVETAAAQPDFLLVGLLSRQERGTLTGLKKKGLLSTSMESIEDGSRQLFIHLTPSGVAAIHEICGITLGASGVEVETAEESPEADVPEADVAEPQKKQAERKAPSAAPAALMSSLLSLYSPLPEAGTCLQKLYKGTLFSVIINADGSVDMEDGSAHYGSLTHAARSITGQKNISGRKFFGCAGKRFFGQPAAMEPSEEAAMDEAAAVEA